MGATTAYRATQPEGGVRLNLNESPREIPQTLKEEILARLAQDPWRRYPDAEMRGCRRLVADWYGLDESWVLFGNGSNELLGAAMQAFSPPEGRILWCSPGFSMVPRQAAWLGRRLVCERLLAPGFTFPGLVGSTALHGADMVLLASPNNPTGTVLPRETLDGLLDCYLNPVVIDEAYGEFADASHTDLLASRPNLVVLRTFSKALSLAGGRIGYALGRPELIGRMEAGKLPFSVGLVQQACIEVLAGAGARSWVEEGVAQVRSERKRVARALGRMPGFQVTDSQANFLFFSPGPGLGEALVRFLSQRDIWIRSFDEAALQDWLRVSIGSPGENDLFMQAVEAFAAREVNNG
jgi:histidinol-phosphate aminotransferase